MSTETEIIIYNTDDGNNYSVTYYALPMVLAIDFKKKGVFHAKNKS